MKLRAVSGHRDTGLTSCPGKPALPAARPRSRSPPSRSACPSSTRLVVRGQDRRAGRVLRPGSRRALPWTITVSGPTAAPRPAARGVGPAVAWTWNAVAVHGRGATRGRWRRGRRCCLRAVSSAVSRCRRQPRPRPGVWRSRRRVVSPNGDGYADLGTVSYTLGARSAVTATVTDATGATVETLFSGAGAVGAARSRSRSRRIALPDGRYTLALVGTRSDDGRTASASAAFTVDRHARVRHGVSGDDLAERRRRRRCAHGVARARGTGPGNRDDRGARRLDGRRRSSPARWRRARTRTGWDGSARGREHGSGRPLPGAGRPWQTRWGRSRRPQRSTSPRRLRSGSVGGRGTHTICLPRGLRPLCPRC